MALRAMVAVLVAGFAVAPAAAAVGQTNFASFVSLPGGTITWQNGLSFGAGGADGALFTAFVPGPQTPSVVAAVPITFNWAAAGIVNSPATFDFRAFASNAPAVLGGPPTFTANQPSLVGSFSILGPVGQPWLTGTFSNGTILTNIGSTSATFQVNSFPGGLVITSGNFQPLLPGGFFLTIQKTGIAAPGIQAVPGQTLSDFDPPFSGVFAGPAVPEPASWVLMIAGFGAVGMAARRRRTGQGTPVYA